MPKISFYRGRKSRLRQGFGGQANIGAGFNFFITLVFLVLVGYLVIKSNKFIQTPALSDNLIYFKNNALLSFDIKTKEKTKLLEEPVLDFDIQKEKLLYLVKEDSGYKIYSKDLEDKDSQLIISAENISTPRFLSSGEIVFVKRDKIDNGFDDGKIVFADQGQERIIFSPLAIEGLKEDEFCSTQEEKSGAKIGIYKTSPFSDYIFYFTKDWGLECSGLVENPRIENLEGKNFFLKRFDNLNVFKNVIEAPWLEQKTIEQDNSWVIKDIFWFSDGSFLVQNIAPLPFYGYSVYYFDKNQSRKWEILDTFKKPEEKTLIIKDALLNNKNFSIIFESRNNEINLELADSVALNSKELNLVKIDSAEGFLIAKFFTASDGANYIVYVKKQDKNYILAIYNILSKELIEIDSSRSEISIR